MKRNSDEWFTLTDYIRALLKDGKRASHEDFQKLFAIYGETKIRAMANEILKEGKK